MIINFSQIINIYEKYTTKILTNNYCPYLLHFTSLNELINIEGKKTNINVLIKFKN